MLAMVAVVAALGWVAMREHRALRAARRDLLSNCLPLVESGSIGCGVAEFPRLSGTYRGRRVAAELMPDTMTVRRLPQLWLSLTLLDSVPVVGGFAVLVRPSGNDFYSLTETFPVTLDPPRDLPWEVLVRGASLDDQQLVDDLAPVMGSILADPKVKELAVTPRGVRIVRQASEGRRGEHLLLRQAVFDEANVPAADFQRVLAWAEDLANRVAARTGRARAA